MIRYLIVAVGLLAMALTFACGTDEGQKAAHTGPTPLLTETQRVEHESVTMTPTDAATTPPPIATARQGTSESVTMTPTNVVTTAPSTPTTGPDSTATPQGHLIAVSGVLDIIWGDPPPDTGLPPRMEYLLTDKQGQKWWLVFDESVYWPPGGLLAFNQKEVKVEGQLVAEDRILVESIRLQ